MADFTASISIEAGMMKLILNGVNFLIVEDGEKKERTRNLGAGKHVVQWYVVGQPGTSYTLDITSPDSATTSITKKIKPVGKDYGSFSFDI